MNRHVLLGCRGCGSAIVEAMFALADIPYEFDEVELSGDGPGRRRLLALNPLGQVPTLLLPDGTVMTESAAIALHVDEIAPRAHLVPPPGDPSRPAFLRWLQFVVCAIYPTYTYGDDPSRWVPAGAAADALRVSTDEHRKRLWLQLDAAASRKGPWFLGTRFSALDLYIAVMAAWRPGRAWIGEHCPRLAACADMARTRPEVADILRLNFP